MTVADDQIRRAGRTLEGALRRPRVSPPVGAIVRRASRHLDVALVSTAAEARHQAIEKAVADLRTCLQMLQEYPDAGDQEQAQSVATALSGLFVLLADPLPSLLSSPAAPPASLSPRPPQGWVTPRWAEAGELIEEALRVLRWGEGPADIARPAATKVPGAEPLLAQARCQLHALAAGAPSSSVHRADLQSLLTDLQGALGALRIRPTHLAAHAQAADTVDQAIVMLATDADSHPAETSADDEEEIDRPRTFTATLAAGHLQEIAAVFDTTELQRQDPHGSWAALRATEARARGHLDALTWMGRSLAEVLLQQIADTEDPGSSFAASLALLADGNELVVSHLLTVLTAGSDNAAVGFAKACWQAAPNALQSRLSTPSFLGATPVHLRAPLVQCFGARGQIPPPALLQLLGQPGDPAVAAAAARALGDGDVVDVAAELEAVALQAGPGVLGEAALTAAVHLGSWRGVEMARSWLARQPSPDIVRLIALAGDETDLPALETLAATEGTLGDAAVESLGWLGAARAVPTLRMILSDESREPQARLALLRITGTGAIAAAGTGDPGRGRFLFGAPWTVAGVLGRVIAPGSSIPERAQLARELAIRTGVRGPAYHVQSGAADQQRVATQWQERLGSQVRRFPAGRWLHAGQVSH